MGPFMAQAPQCGAVLRTSGDGDPSVTTGTPRVLRAINDRSALELLTKHGPLSRSQLVRLTGLSKPTTGEVLSRLLAEGLVVLAGTTSGTRGPHAQLYDINNGLAHVAGVNAEEDCVTAAVADLTGRIVGEASIATSPASGDNPVPAVQRALRSAARRARQPVRSMHHVVVGVAGSFDASSDQVLYADDLSGWDSPAVVRQLRKALHVPLTIENDANLAAVAERTRGSAQEVDTFTLLWVGRGLGLAVEFGGRLYRGATGGAGEVGYIPVAGTSAGPSATFQDAIGSDAVLELARRHGSSGTSPDAVLSEADDDEPFLQELARRLATCVATIVAVLDPPLLVLSGPTCQRGGHPLARLTEAELHRISPFRTPLSMTSVSANPVLLGAVDTAVAQARSEIFASVGADPWMPAAPAPEASA
jgi:predicted NBD/HSP70 family sugar kinase